MPNGLIMKLKYLAFYQIAGGVLGIGVVIWSLIQAASISGLTSLLLILALVFYSFSFYCGQQLLKGEVKRALKLSFFNQVIQMFIFSIAGFSFKYVSGLMLSVGIDWTHDFKLTLNFALSSFQFNFGLDKEALEVSINLIAIILLFFIDRLQKQIVDEPVNQAAASSFIDLDAY